MKIKFLLLNQMKIKNQNKKVNPNEDQLRKQVCQISNLEKAQQKVPKKISKMNLNKIRQQM